MPKHYKPIFLIIISLYATPVFAASDNSAHLADSLSVPPQCTPYVGLIEQYPWNVQTAINVMFQESSCNPNNVNLKDTEKHKSNLYRDYPLGYCIGSFGLFQTSCTRQIYYDPALNIELAYEIYKVQGWKAWSTTCKKISCLT